MASLATEATPSILVVGVYFTKLLKSRGRLNRFGFDLLRRPSEALNEVATFYKSLERRNPLLSNRVANEAIVISIPILEIAK